VNHASEHHPATALAAPMGQQLTSPIRAGFSATNIVHSGMQWLAGCAGTQRRKMSHILACRCSSSSSSRQQ
jgi:hypothetical protein